MRVPRLKAAVLRRRVVTAASFIYRQRERLWMKSSASATHAQIPQESVDAYTVWEEPNRANSHPLHIGRSGQRFSTLTGVWWLDDQTVIVNHRSGLRMAVFELDRFEQPVWVTEIPHLTDDIAAKRVDDSTWEVAVSGCFDNIYTRCEVQKDASSNDPYKARILDVLEHTQRDFSHGVAYDHKGQLCYGIHFGSDPRLAIGAETYRLPVPWGVRDVCYDRFQNRYIAVAVSSNPQRKSYGGVKTGLWVFSESDPKWKCLGIYDNIHSDAVDVWQECIWIPDQVGNQLIAIDAKTGAMRGIYDGQCLDFPHGLGISTNGKIAVTNYGSSSVAILDPEKLLALS